MRKILLVAIISGVFFATSAAGAGETYKAVVGSDGAQHVDILGGSYFFKPDHIIVKVNVPVEFKVRKEPGFVPHDIVIDAPIAGVYVKESLDTEPKVIRFTPNKTGRYSFYCDKSLLGFHKHRDKGMEGTLEVTE
ncbi:MAG TPA: quinol oxidase [Geobacteraceae bacterium]|nr:quinol oxidase [Geobacteraceae bacterium]